MIIEKASTELQVIVYNAITEVGEKRSRSVPLFPEDFTGPVPSQTKNQIMEQIKEGGIRNDSILKAIKSNLDSMVCEVKRKDKFVLRVRPGLQNTLFKIIEQHTEENQKKEDNNLLLIEPSSKNGS